MPDEEHLEPTIKTDDTTEQLITAEQVDQKIPGFRLLQKLGEGGMGEVFAAEQLEPVRRKVALKLIKRGMESKDVLARFDGERQALAIMNHPAIARVFDAGATTDGRPYFVMEYVQGVPVTDYCDRNQLTPDQRLELFLQICDGVQHAHHKGVVHRDIKPSNVLVTIQDSRPVPKIIDFGIAKATSQRLTEQSVFTAMGEFIGTPEYMSPEQADLTGLDIDTRTDVYSLGVVLYELLVGAQPFDSQELRRAGFDEMRRRIREDEPPRPSVRFSGLGDKSTTAAENRDLQPSTLARRLHGDLDWITMKALEKDRTRRYDSPGELASDIERHLRDEPVLAGPPSTAYRLKKFIQRHTVGVAAGAIVALALALGVGGITVGLIRAKQAEQTATREAETARQVSDFMIDLFQVSDPSAAKGETITARELLDQGAERIENELRDRPLVRARMMNTIGDVYWKLGLYEDAHTLLTDALETRRSLLGENHGDVVESVHGLATLLSDMGRYDEAERLYEEALTIAEAAHGSDHQRVAITLNNMANLEEKLGHYDDARSLHERALEIRLEALGEEHPLTITTMENLAVLEAKTGQFESARELFEKNLEIKQRLFDANDPKIAISLNNLATVLNQMGDFDSARPYLERALAIREEVLGTDHPLVATTIQNLAMTEHQAGNLESAQALYERALDLMEGSLGSDHPDLAYPMANLAELWRYRKNYDTARSLHQRAMEIRRANLGSGHPLVAASLHNMAMIDQGVGDLNEARRKLRQAIQIYESSVPPGHPWLGKALRDLAMIDHSAGEFESARQGLETAAQILQNDPITRYQLACACARSGDVPAALDSLETAVDLGFADVGHLESDPDLESLRQTERFDAIVERLRAPDRVE